MYYLLTVLCTRRAIVDGANMENKRLNELPPFATKDCCYDICRHEKLGETKDTNSTKSIHSSLICPHSEIQKCRIILDSVQYRFVFFFFGSRQYEDCEVSRNRCWTRAREVYTQLRLEWSVVTINSCHSRQLHRIIRAIFI